MNPEECQNEINADEKVMEEHEKELEELSEKVKHSFRVFYSVLCKICKKSHEVVINTDTIFQRQIFLIVVNTYFKV